jgi:hypothetical protein
MIGRLQFQGNIIKFEEEVKERSQGDKVVVEFAAKKWLDSSAAGDKKRQKFSSRLVFLAFRRVICVAVKGYT